MTREAMQVVADPVVTQSAAWLESARLAYGSGDASFQGGRSSAGAIAGLIKGATLDEEQRSTVERARNVLGAPTPSATDAADAIGKLLSAMAR